MTEETSISSVGNEKISAIAWPCPGLACVVFSMCLASSALYHLINCHPLVPITRFSNKIAQLCHCQKMSECCIISPGMLWLWLCYHKANNICSSVRVLFRKPGDPGSFLPADPATSDDDPVTIQTCQHLPVPGPGGAGWGQTNSM